MPFSLNHFIGCLRSLCIVDASIVLVGDFNFPNIDWSNLQLDIDSDRCSTCFSMFVKQYCFDPFIVGLCDVAICDPFSVSEHCSIKFNVITPGQSAGIPAHDFRDFNTADWSSITSNLYSCDWSTVFKDSQFADAFYAELK